MPLYYLFSENKADISQTFFVMNKVVSNPPGTQSSMKSAIKVPSLWSIQSAIKLVVPKDLRLSFSKGFTNIASDQLLHQKALVMYA